MKNKKKQAILIVITAIICLCFNITFAHAKGGDAAAEKLSAFGITDRPKQWQSLSENITRGEAAEVFFRYMKLEGTLYKASETPFVDISIYDENVAMYNTLYELGIIQGDNTGRFNPDRFITCNEALKLTVTAMGYKFFAEKNGGYPGGYISAAVKVGLLENVSTSGDGYITRGEFYAMLEASLEADSVDDTHVKGDGSVEITVNKEMTVLEKIHGISKLRALVTGNENTRLTTVDASNIGRYDIEIDGKLYKSGEKEFADFLGFNVYAYVKENSDGENEVVYMEKTPSNRYTLIDADDIQKNGCTSTTLKYESDNKYKSLSFNKDALTVILNGKYYPSYSEIAGILPDEGSVGCIDNSGDGKIDILIINESRNFVVGFVDAVKGELTEKYTGEKLCASKREDDVRLYNESGSEITLDDIKQSDVLTVFETADVGGYRLIKLFLSGTVIKETVIGIEDNEKYFIGDKSYKLAANVTERIKKREIPLPDVGDSINFTVDINGKIADYTIEATADMLYGVVAARSEELKLKDGMQIKIFNQHGEWITAKAADKIKIDGEKYSANSGDGFHACRGLLPVGEVIRYKLTDGKITHIDTVNPDKDALTSGQDEGNLKLITEGSQFVSRGGICYKYGSNGIDSEAYAEKFVLTGSTVVFRIPERTNLSDESLYSVSNSIGGNYFSQWTPHGDGSVKIKEGYSAYGTKDEDIEIASCVLLRGCEDTGVGISYYDKFYVITDIRTAIDENGDTVPLLYYSQGSGEASSPVAEKVFFSFGNSIWSAQRESDFYAEKLRAGDIIQLGFKNGTVNYINVIYRIDQTAPNKGWAWAAYPMYNAGFDLDKGIICARVNAVKCEPAIVQYYVGTDRETAARYNISVPEYIPVVIYRQDEKTVETGNIASLVDDDLIIVKCSYGTNAEQIIVIR